MVDDRSLDLSDLGIPTGCSDKQTTEFADLGDFDTEDFCIMRRMMVRELAAERENPDMLNHDMTIDEAVIAAMGNVSRHAFVPEPHAVLSYMDAAIPIGYGKHLTDPLSVAFMTSALKPKPGLSVLEVGTGLGYHSALLQELGLTVTTCEIVGELALAAQDRLTTQNCKNVRVVEGNVFSCGVLEEKFDRILVSAACDIIPLILLESLNPDGVLVIPGQIETEQRLISVQRHHDGTTESIFGPVTNLQSLCNLPSQSLASA